MNRTVEDRNPLGDSRYFVYDAADNLTERTDRNGRVREFDYEFDSLGGYRLTQERWLDETALIVETVNWAFDSNTGLLQSVDDSGSSYSFGYDAFLRLATISMTEAATLNTSTMSYGLRNRGQATLGLRPLWGLRNRGQRRS